jgi:nucleoside-diphosphate-sugar epimerase
MLYSSLLERMLKGKAPQSLAKPGVKHTFAYTEDNGRALVALALDDGAYGEVWHLPAGTPITTEEVVEYFNKELKTNLKPQFISPLFRRFLGMFIPILREAGEMNYQFETDYIMSFEKFKNRFPNFNVMPMEEGLQIMTKSFRNHV